MINARHPLLKGNPVPLNIEIGTDFNGSDNHRSEYRRENGGFENHRTDGGDGPGRSADCRVSHESCVPIFDNIYSDIGDEQSIEQTLSTFSWHIGNIVRILKESTDKSLVLLDELGTSTDPSEGAALAQSILLNFLNCGAMVVATTHFSELKAFAHATHGLRNASLDFDPVTLAPTYHLTVGIPGGSNALAIASQLGLPEEIIAGARERLSKGSLEIETLLADLMQEKQKLTSMQESARKDREEAEKLRREMEEQRKNFRQQEQDDTPGDPDQAGPGRRRITATNSRCSG